MLNKYVLFVLLLLKIRIKESRNKLVVLPLFPEEKLIPTALVLGIKAKERSRQDRDWSSYGSWGHDAVEPHKTDM